MSSNSSEGSKSTSPATDSSENIAQNGVESELSRTSSSTSRQSLGSSYNSDNDDTEIEIRPLQEDPSSKPYIRRIKSIRDQIEDDNLSILEEEKEAKNNLEKRLQREFSIEDSMRIRRVSTSRSHARDEEVGLEVPSSTIAKVFTNASTGTVDLPPDGGYGWVCVFCAFLILFSTWGNNSAFGVYLAYYIDNDTFPGSTRMDFAWIAGLIVFGAQAFAPFAMIADRMIGFKLTMSIALCTHFAGYLLASFATKIWHLYVCQGVIVGISYSFLFVPACTIIPSWFLKKRAIASGLLCSGTGLGGLVYSLSINAMIQRTGDQRWSLRMVSILTTVVMAVAIFLIKRRNDTPRQKMNFHNLNMNLHAMFDWKVLKTPRLWYITLWFSIALLGYNMTLFSYASSATAMGFSQHDASTLTAVVNAAQALGRPTMGLIADKWVGRVNYSMVLNAVVIVLIFAFWISARSLAALIVCGACLGFTLGVGNVMNTVLIADAFSPEEFSCAWAILNMVMAFFVLFVEVIALSLRDDSLSNPFLYAQIFAGCIFTLAIFFLVPLREWHIRTLLLQRQKTAKNEIEKLQEPYSEKDQITNEDLNMKLTIYDKLLARSIQGYLKRAFYPVKV
uniref:MFS transporter n=1 Tax=Cyberlindnera americana TaxID=36016 RepID=A0A5P8N8L9_9ASCO|nr:MFS transporter [Cyberlindnera americana]